MIGAKMISIKSRFTDTLTEGEIAFGSGTFQSPFNTSSDLFWDDTNTRLGIGTDNPQANLHIDFNILSGTRGIIVNDNSPGHFPSIELQGSGSRRCLFRYFSSNNAVEVLNRNNVGISLNDNDNVFIGSPGSTPASKLTVDAGDAEVTGSGNGLILESPDGTRWRVQIDNAGSLTTTSL